MDSKRTLNLAGRVIAQILRDHRTLALILVVPLVVLTVAGVLIRISAGEVTIGVVNRDEGTSILMRTVNMADEIAANLDAMEMVIVQTYTPDEAGAALEAGAVDAVVAFGPDFSADAQAAGRVTLDVTMEGSDPMGSMQAQAALTRAGVETMAGMMSALGFGGGASLEAGELPVQMDAAYRYGGPAFDSLDYMAPVFIGLFVFLFVFILTSVAFLRERAAGTLERLQATPATRTEIMVGYMLGFSMFALAQSVIILLFTVYALGVHHNGNLLVVFVVELLLTLVSVNMGIFFSTFARNEFQVVQFIPLVVVTQMLLSGALWAIEDMPRWLQPVAWLMPLTYANRALRDVMIKGFGLAEVLPYLGVLVLFAAGMVLAGASTIGRQQA